MYPLHRQTRQIISQVEETLGSKIPWVECFELIADLDVKVRRCFEPAEIDKISILDHPVKAGNTEFYALTLAAQDWFEEFCRCFPEAPTMHEAGWLYASAHSMQSDVLCREWSDLQKLGMEVFKWRASCGVKPGQIEAIKKLLNPELPWPDSKWDTDADKRGYAGVGWITAELCKLRPDPDYWRNNVPMLKALQEYRNSVLYNDSDIEVRHKRMEKWAEAAMFDKQRAIQALIGKFKAVIGYTEPEPAHAPEKAAEATSEANNSDAQADSLLGSVVAGKSPDIKPEDIPPVSKMKRVPLGGNPDA